MPPPVVTRSGATVMVRPPEPRPGPLRGDACQHVHRDRVRHVAVLGEVDDIFTGVTQRAAASVSSTGPDRTFAPVLSFWTAHSFCPVVVVGRRHPLIRRHDDVRASRPRADLAERVTAQQRLWRSAHVSSMSPNLRDPPWRLADMAVGAQVERRAARPREAAEIARRSQSCVDRGRRVPGVDRRVVVGGLPRAPAPRSGHPRSRAGTDAAPYGFRAVVDPHRGAPRTVGGRRGPSSTTPVGPANGRPLQGPPHGPIAGAHRPPIRSCQLRHRSLSGVGEPAREVVQPEGGVLAAVGDDVGLHVRPGEVLAWGEDVRRTRVVVTNPDAGASTMQATRTPG